jgi:hypothetical protein
MISPAPMFGIGWIVLSREHRFWPRWRITRAQRSGTLSGRFETMWH